MKIYSTRFALVVTLMLVFQYCFSQQVMMQGWYWDYPKTATGNSWADTLRIKAASLKQAGFTHIWFPPHAAASSGSNSNGYDPKDLFIGNQTTGLGSRSALNAMLNELNSQGIAPVADMIYNHRDGGAPEPNSAVKNYILNHYTAAKEPFPSDRYRVVLPLGGPSGNVAGDYYFKISSMTNDGRFNNYGYKLYMETKTKGWQNQSPLNETEPNGGGDCGQANNNTSLGRDMIATVETGGGCGTDEFHLNLSTSDFNGAGDTLFIYLSNTGGYSDHRIYGLYSAPRGADIADDLIYQTYTNFSGMPSGRGQMNFESFKPNSANASTTFLNGDWDGMYFFYDYDQFQNATRDTLINYTKWNWTDLGVRGLRMDAVKHFAPGFVGDLLDSLHAGGMDPSMVVGEWYSANTAELNGWVNNVKAAMDPATQAAIPPKIFDFALRENLRKASDDPSFDTRNVFSGSLHDAAGTSGYNIVTFLNNHDFRDASGFASLVRNHPMLGYVYILTNNQLGVPTIFYPDYYGYPAPAAGMYTYHPTDQPLLQPQIDRLIKVLKLYINGSPTADYLNRFSTPYASSFIQGSSNKALIYQLQGFPANGNKDLIVAINYGNTTLKVDHGINTRGGAIIPGTRFTDILGYSAFPAQVVSGSNQVYIELPPNSYSVWVQGDLPVLPLHLGSFNAIPRQNKVQLKWMVTDNQEAAGFEVERADDASNFNTIGHVVASNQNGDAAYQFMDNHPLHNKGMLYRLKILFKSGAEQYSDLRLVRINGREMMIRVRNNPVTDKLNFSLTDASSSEVTAQIVSSNGQVVKKKQWRISNNDASLDIPVSSLAAGVYLLVIQNGDSRKTIQFIRQ